MLTVSDGVLTPKTEEISTVSEGVSTTVSEDEWKIASESNHTSSDESPQSQF